MVKDSNEGDWSIYPYEPNKPAPMAFAVLLFVVGSYQIYQSFVKYHWKKFGAMMTWATSVWIAGFICRSISIYQLQNVGMFIAQFVLIIMGPPLYAAAEYFILGRLTAYLPYYASIHPGRVFSTFAILSAIVESLTANGAANSSGTGRTEAQIKNGLNTLKAALILQCFIEVCFFSLVARLEYRCRKEGKFPRQLRMVFLILYVTSFMILVRCILRTIEGFEAASCNHKDANPYCGFVTKHEVFLWVFEVANITLFVILLGLFHPGRYLPRSSNIYLDPVDMKTERIGPGFSKADKRPLAITIVDPFNIYGIVTGKGMTMTKFWEQEHPVYTGQDLKLVEKNMEAAQSKA